MSGKGVRKVVSGLPITTSLVAAGRVALDGSQLNEPLLGDR